MNIDNSNFNPTLDWEKQKAAVLYAATDDVIKCFASEQLAKAGFAIDSKLEILLGKDQRLTVPEGEIKAWVKIAELIDFARLAQQINTLTPNVNNQFSIAVKSYSSCNASKTDVCALVKEISAADYQPSLANLTDGFKNTTGLLSQVAAYLKPNCWVSTTPEAKAIKINERWVNAVKAVKKIFAAQNPVVAERVPIAPQPPKREAQVNSHAAVANDRVPPPPAIPSSLVAKQSLSRSQSSGAGQNEKPAELPSFGDELLNAIRVGIKLKRTPLKVAQPADQTHLVAKLNSRNAAINGKSK